jgi:hypothetical protein
MRPSAAVDEKVDLVIVLWTPVPACLRSDKIVPHVPQNLLSGGLTAPHRPHFAGIVAPHFVQKCEPSWLSA